MPSMKKRVTGFIRHHMSSSTINHDLDTPGQTPRGAASAHNSPRSLAAPAEPSAGNPKQSRSPKLFNNFIQKHSSKHNIEKVSSPDKAYGKGHKNGNGSKSSPVKQSHHQIGKGNAGTKSHSGGFIQKYLAEGDFNDRRRPSTTPEIWSGKTGHDLPVFKLDKVNLDPEIFAAFTGPDGGVTSLCPSSLLKDDLSRRCYNLGLLDEDVENELDGCLDEGDFDFVDIQDQGKRPPAQNGNRKQQVQQTNSKDKTVIKERTSRESQPRNAQTSSAPKRQTSVETDYPELGGDLLAWRGNNLSLDGSNQSQASHASQPHLNGHSSNGGPKVSHLHSNHLISRRLKQDLRDVTDTPIAGIRHWNRPNNAASGQATTLYERHPHTAEHAGNPIADSFAIVARKNSSILVLGDGVNWGAKAALASRCAVYACFEHLNDVLFGPETGKVNTTQEVFQSLLRSFHAAHSMILAKGAQLTTLTACVVIPVKDEPPVRPESSNKQQKSSPLPSSRKAAPSSKNGSRDNNNRKEDKRTSVSASMASNSDNTNSSSSSSPLSTPRSTSNKDSSGTKFVVCVCNVGDSLAYIYSPDNGQVREITLASHDIQSNRDMRDALGALGPVDGINPELSNLTCSITPVKANDIVFLTSDGISDNFDPVVGKFCVPARDIARVPHQSNRNSTHSNGGDNSQNQGQPTSAPPPTVTLAPPSLPSVEAYQRHELTLLRMEDILNQGSEGANRVQTAAELCHRLVDFCQRLTTAKRKILEDPELYPEHTKHALPDSDATRLDQKMRRRRVCDKLAMVPGKLDHATVTAYSVMDRRELLKNYRASMISTCSSQDQRSSTMSTETMTSSKAPAVQMALRAPHASTEDLTYREDLDGPSSQDEDEGDEDEHGDATPIPSDAESLSSEKNNNGCSSLAVTPVHVPKPQKTEKEIEEELNRET